MKHVPAVLCLAAALMLGQATPPAAAVSSNAISESFLVGGGGTLTLRTDQGKLEVGSRPGNEVTIAITSARLSFIGLIIGIAPPTAASK